MDTIDKEWIEFKSKIELKLKDLDEFEDKLFKAIMKFEDTKKSRENWKNKYMELKNDKNAT